MVEDRVTIENKYGFHARPSTTFAQMAVGFSCQIEVSVEDQRVDGKSVMGLLTLGAPQGTVIGIHCDGPDEAEALQALTAHVRDRFGGIE